PVGTDEGAVRQTLHSQFPLIASLPLGTSPRGEKREIAVPSFNASSNLPLSGPNRDEESLSGQPLAPSSPQRGQGGLKGRMRGAVRQTRRSRLPAGERGNQRCVLPGQPCRALRIPSP